MEKIILVDEQDNEIGTAEKMEAHEKALLHRAFSVFVFNSDGLMLLQQRAFSKYHSGGLWTNACCSHPRAGEDTLDAAYRRLQEEMGFTTPLQRYLTLFIKPLLTTALPNMNLTMYLQVFITEIYVNVTMR
jgi:isopentenyl-diphosphate Delta-isomerase